MYLIKYHTMKTYGGVEVQLHSFITLALDGDEWSAWCPNHFTLQKRSWYPFHRRLAGHQSLSGCSGWEKKSLPLPGIKP